MALRERKKDQTREALAKAAFELFSLKGFEATTAAEIAAAANVSRRTFFRYFPSKDELLFIDNEPRLERFREHLSVRQPDDDAFAPVYRACLAMAEEFMGERDKILARLQIIEASPVLGKQERQQDLEWEEAISVALLTGLAAPSPRARRKARLIAGAVFGAIRAALAEWLQGGGEANLVERAEEGLALFARVLDTELRDDGVDGSAASPSSNPAASPSPSVETTPAEGEPPA
jgi:AcrR family transcriptional regulator